MKQLALALALISIAACGKKDDKAPAGDKMADKASDKPADKGSDTATGSAAPVAAGDVADVDCEKMTTHNVEVLMKDATAGKSDEDKKQMNDMMTAQHEAMVKACEGEKTTKKLTHKQYDCILASQTTAELTACVTK